MIVVGLTGGIGGGKTTVANCFLELGVPVYVADQHAKRLMNSSKTIKRKLLNEFGKDSYLNGKLNRAYLAQIVFNDKQKLAAINSIVHPSVANSFKRWVGKQKTHYVLQENAILFENNSFNKFDYIITVTAPLETRIDRVMKRDQVTKKQVLARIKNQLSEEEKIKRSDFVIVNTNIDKIKRQVLKIHKELLGLKN